MGTAVGFTAYIFNGNTPRRRTDRDPEFVFAFPQERPKEKRTGPMRDSKGHFMKAGMQSSPVPPDERPEEEPLTPEELEEADAAAEDEDEEEEEE